MITTTGKPIDMVGDVPSFTYTATPPDGITDTVTGITVTSIRPDGTILPGAGVATELAPNVWRWVGPAVDAAGTWVWHIVTAGLVDVGEIKAIVGKSSAP